MFNLRNIGASGYYYYYHDHHHLLFESRFRDYRRFRSDDSETIWVDLEKFHRFTNYNSETTDTDSETNSYRLKQLGRFRHCDSETVSPDSENTIQKLFCPIQELRFRNSFFGPIQETISRPLTLR